MTRIDKPTIRDQENGVIAHRNPVGRPSQVVLAWYFVGYRRPGFKRKAHIDIPTDLTDPNRCAVIAPGT